LQSSGVIHDDIMDGTEIRRGMKCWYKKEDIGTMAIEDGRIITKGIYLILKKYFSNHPYYVQFLESFHELDMLARIGQALDEMYMTDGLKYFNMTHYYKLAKYKTYHLFTLPIIIAMYLSGQYNQDVYEKAESICCELGIFFQIKNDFKDCFAYYPIGSDIRQGKFTWLAIFAVEKGTVEQRSILEKHYGQNNSESESIIFNLYNELCLTEEYNILRKDRYNYIVNRILDLSKPSLQRVLNNYVEELFI
ncbi:hypothetical protein ILUMI_19006, partial [Ignelater luminosus]